MTADTLQPHELFSAIDEKATNEQKLLNQLRELQEEIRRLKPYEHFCEVQSRFITSIGRNDDLHAFIKKEQRQQKAEKKRHKFFVVGD